MVNDLVVEVLSIRSIGSTYFIADTVEEKLHTVGKILIDLFKVLRSKIYYVILFCVKKTT